ncbi:DUF2155 domain-containing protein [Brevundimonas sp.]|uniref:DUF2155 domain-containing protein n=1 Tax=Brevundimonas sp. TaxID=1871086 RepID=UPI0025E1977E|nr:DUF2155 domain-containing protein [Brevundimonas sp.]
MSRPRWVASGALAAVLVAGLAVATPAPVPPADPIGDVIARPTQPPPGEEVPPPPPGEVPNVVRPGPTPPPEELIVDVEPIEVAEAEEEAEEVEETPLPEAPPAPQLPRQRRQVAIIQALDKVTAETIRFEAPVGQQRRWRGLVFRVRACESTAEDEPLRDSIAYLEIRSQTQTRDGRASSRQIFQGWMFASAPGLNPIEHNLYDVWVISCQTREPEAPTSRR